MGTIPILDWPFGQPTPNNIGIKTTDYVFQYDGLADFPLYLTNPFAVLNAIAGFVYVHGNYLLPNGNDPTGTLPYGYTPETLAAAIRIPTTSELTRTRPSC